jgi:hypothetical protein
VVSPTRHAAAVRSGEGRHSLRTSRAAREGIRCARAGRRGCSPGERTCATGSRVTRRERVVPGVGVEVFPRFAGAPTPWDPDCPMARPMHHRRTCAAAPENRVGTQHEGSHEATARRRRTDRVHERAGTAHVCALSERRSGRTGTVVGGPTGKHLAFIRARQSMARCQSAAERSGPTPCLPSEDRATAGALPARETPAARPSGGPGRSVLRERRRGGRRLRRRWRHDGGPPRQSVRPARAFPRSSIAQRVSQQPAAARSDPQLPTGTGIEWSPFRAPEATAFAAAAGSSDAPAAERQPHTRLRLVGLGNAHRDDRSRNARLVFHDRAPSRRHEPACAGQHPRGGAFRCAR